MCMSVAQHRRWITAVGTALSAAGTERVEGQASSASNAAPARIDTIPSPPETAVRPEYPATAPPRLTEDQEDFDDDRNVTS